MAAEQTAGRGRQGRLWTAASGTALLTSVLLRPPPAVLPLVPMIGGVAAADALASVTGLEAGLKWPNDVMVHGAKLAGLLAEVEPSSQGHDAVVLGMGLNLHVEEFPRGVRGLSLHEAVATAPSWDSLLTQWIIALSSWLARTERDGAGPLLGAWRRRAVGLGGTVEASTSGGTIRGIATGIDHDGALLVSTPTGVLRLVAGDVHLQDDLRTDPGRDDGAGSGTGAAPEGRPAVPERRGPT